MALYRSLSDFPDRIEQGLQNELQTDEELVAGVPSTKEIWLTKYLAHYALTSGRFIKYLKTPFGSSSTDAIDLASVDRVEVEITAVDVTITLHGPGYVEDYSFSDGGQSGDAEQFARMVREHAIE